jgi:hypothetical protein
MRVYVASRYSERGKARTRAAHDAFRNAGHSITHDWTHEDDTLTGLVKDRYLTECAILDYEGVVDADAFVLLVEPEMKGAWTELGMALATLRTVIIIGGTHENIFERMPEVHHCDSVDEAMRLLALIEAAKKNEPEDLLW